MPPKKGRKRAAAAATNSDSNAATNGDSKAAKAANNDDSKATKKGDSKAAKAAKNGDSKAAKKGDSKAKAKVLKVDSECPKSSTCGIYVGGDDGSPYACVLNQTNISQNNNKFFIIQVIKENKANKFYAWIRWGRVGYTGQTALTDCGKDVQKAISIFEKKFLDKTKNKWSERSEFAHFQGKYDLVQTEVGADDDEEEDVDDEVDSGPTANKVAKNVEVEPSKLEKAVQELVQMICDVKTMELNASELEFDTKRNPLGKISLDQIKAGYESLNKIAELLTQPSVNMKKVKDASSEFYTRIPHCFGFRTPPPIMALEKVKEKIKLLEVLGDIKLGLDIMKDHQDLDENLNPIDRYYRNLQCGLKALPHDDDSFSMVEQYIMSTHAKTHSHYTMDLLDVFECDKTGAPFADEKGNRKLLFHGSRMSNWAGILSQGLRIAPPEAPVTGYMFGKGIYFADMSSKSANYCYASKKNPYGLLLLCEVALGETNDLFNADYDAGKLPKGKSSTKGVGEVSPLDKNAITMDDGTVVPMGPAAKVTERRSLIYNEYIVYSVDQVRLRYIAKIKFEFN